MKYEIKSPAIFGDTCNLQSVAHAMALKRATAAGGKWDEVTFDAMLTQYSTWLRDAAHSGHLITSNSSGIPTSWDALMGEAEPEDVTVACCRAWVNLEHLNAWAHDAGHKFTIQTEGVPWIDHRGVVGGSLNEPLTFSVDGNTHKVGFKHHKSDQAGPPHVDAPDGERLLEARNVHEQTGQQSLTTTEIAQCFGGLAGWNYGKWKQKLAHMPKWLQKCLVTPGQRGGDQRRWDPLKIGMVLVEREGVKANSVRARFQTVDLLRPWLDDWKDYEYKRLDE